MKRHLLNLLSTAVIAIGGAHLMAQPAEAQSSATNCDTLVCGDIGCCTVNSETGDICSCKKWEVE